MLQTFGDDSRMSVRELLQEELGRLQDLRDRLSCQSHGDLLAVTERALRAAGCPACAETQADGVPCETTGTSCEECVKALGWIRSLRTRIEAEERALSGAYGWEI